MQEIRVATTLLQATHRGTPPEDLRRSRQVSWLAGQYGCLAFPMPQGISDAIDSRSPLTVAGAAPASNIAFRATSSPNSLLASASHAGEPKNHDNPKVGYVPPFVNGSTVGTQYYGMGPKTEPQI